MKNYEAIIFDLDGTLWNAITVTADGWNKALKNIGTTREITSDEVAKVTGKSALECIKILFPEFVDTYPNFKLILDRYERMEIEDRGAKFYSGVIEGLKNLSQKKKIYLVSNCEDWYLELFFKFSELKSYFSDWNCYGLCSLSKGEMLLDMRNKHLLKNVVYVGDTAGDQEAAEFACLDFIHVSYGFGKVKKGTIAVSNFPELIEFLAK